MQIIAPGVFFYIFKIQKRGVFSLCQLRFYSFGFGLRRNSSAIATVSYYAPLRIVEYGGEDAQAGVW